MSSCQCFMWKLTFRQLEKSSFYCLLATCPTLFCALFMLVIVKQYRNNLFIIALWSCTPILFPQQNKIQYFKSAQTFLSKHMPTSFRQQCRDFCSSERMASRNSHGTSKYFRTSMKAKEPVRSAFYKTNSPKRTTASTTTLLEISTHIFKEITGNLSQCIKQKADICLTNKYANWRKPSSLARA